MPHLSLFLFVLGIFIFFALPLSAITLQYSTYPTYVNIINGMCRMMFRTLVIEEGEEGMRGA
jgi:hypothetical protein